MKKVLSIILAVLLICSTGTLAIPASAATVVASGRSMYVNWKLESDGKMTLSGNGYTADFTQTDRPPWESYKTQIKSLVISNGVTKIGHFAFVNYTALTGSLTLPSSMREVGSSAFDGCTGFNGTLTLNSGLTTIGPGAFRNCLFIGNLSIPDSVTTLGAGAFQHCACFNGTLHLSKNITGIGYATFAGCGMLKGDLVIPDSVTEISAFAFSRCMGLNGILTIGSSVKSIKWQAFEECSGLTGDLIIPNSVTKIDYSAFSHCTGFNGRLQLGNRLEELGENENSAYGAFFQCSGLTGDLVLPDSLKTIGKASFYGCSNLTGELALPSGLTTIGDRAFYGCYNLSGTLEIPESVTTLGTDPFHACARDTDIVQFFANYPSYISVSETVTTRPSCTTTGMKTVKVTCTKCGGQVMSKEETIPTKHSLISFARKEPSDGRDGTLAYYYCPLCDKYFLDADGTQEVSIDDLAIHCPRTPEQENAILETADHPASFDMVTRCQTHRTIILESETITLTPHPAKEATYTEDGNIKYYTDGNGTKYVYDEQRRLFVENDDVFIHLTLIPATSIEVNAEEIELRVDDTFQLTATVEPADASLKNVSFTSSDETVLSVTEDGLITALKPGTATVTCSTEEGLTVTVTVTVEHKHVAGEPALENNTKQATCCESGVGDLVTRCTECGEELDRERNVTIPATGIHPTELVPAREATAEADGNIAYYICTTCDGLFLDEEAKQPTTAEELTLHFADAPRIENSKPETENQPASFELATYCKHDGTELDRKTVTLEMHPEVEASLLGDGNVKYYTDEDGNKYVYDEETESFKLTDDVLVPFVPIAVEKINVNETELHLVISDTFQLETTTEPEDATFPQVIFESSDDTVAEVNPLGLVTAKGEGTATIECVTGDGASATVTVTVQHRHVADEPAVEDVTKEATCTETGTGDMVTRCEICGEELDRESNVVIPATGIHLTELVPAREPSEEADGYTRHYICTSCDGLFLDEEAKQPTTSEEIALHFADAPKMENVRLETDDSPASFDLVTYCKHDDTELSRETITLTVHTAKEATPTEDGNVKYYTDENGKMFVYDEETELFTETETVSTQYPVVMEEELVLSGLGYTIPMYAQATLTATVLPENATFPEVIFTVEDPTVIRFDEDGTITPLAIGETNIIVTTHHGITRTVPVKVVHGHVAGEPHFEDILLAPTCVMPGSGMWVVRCAECGAFMRSVGPLEIPPTGIHLTELVPAREPSEEEDGYTQHYICTSCAALFRDEEAKQPTTEEEIVLHFADAPRIENSRSESEGQPASFELATYCLHDHTELDRKTVVLEMHPAKEATPTEDGNVKYYTDEDGNKYVYDEDTEAFVPLEDVFTQFPVVPVTDIELNEDQIELREGETFQLIATVQPEDATFREISFTSSDDSILSVNEEGLITAIKPGSATVVCRTQDGVSVTVTVTVEHKHVAGEPSIENITKEPTCKENGLGDLVTRCTVCGEELDRETGVAIPATGKHTPGEGQKTQEVKGTCETEGSYVLIVKCTVCGELLSSETISTGFGDHAWNDGDVQSGKYDKYTVTDYTCQNCGQHKTEKTRNPNYQFRCKRCDWYDARRDTKGVLGLIYKLIHDITHMVQRINFLT